MKVKQECFTMTAEEAIKVFGCHYVVSEGMHNEDFNLSIKQVIGEKSLRLASNNSYDSIEDSILRSNSILKEHCKNAINRYTQHSKSITGEVFYFLHKNNLLSNKRQVVTTDYLEMIEEARNILANGKKPSLKYLAKSYLVPVNYPHLEQTFYVVDKDFSDDFFKIEEFLTTKIEIYDWKTENPSVDIINFSGCVQNKESDNKSWITYDSVSEFNGVYYSLNNEKLAFVNLDDAKKYAHEQLNHVIDKANLAIKYNLTKVND